METGWLWKKKKIDAEMEEMSSKEAGGKGQGAPPHREEGRCRWGVGEETGGLCHPYPPSPASVKDLGVTTECSPDIRTGRSLCHTELALLQPDLNVSPPPGNVNVFTLLQCCCSCCSCLHSDMLKQRHALTEGSAAARPLTWVTEVQKAPPGGAWPPAGPGLMKRTWDMPWP